MADSTRWKSYWEEHPRKFGADQLREQVGKVWQGSAIDDAQLDALIGDVTKALGLRKDDRLLDLCCGNGLVTARLAERCATVVGVDYSEPLLEVARDKFASERLRFVEGELPRLDALAGEAPFDAVMMYEGLQHFEEWQLSDLLDSLSPFVREETVVVFGSVPDAERKWSFFDTPERRADYLRRCRLGEPPIGTWWHRVIISDEASRHGYDATFLEQSPTLHTAHYRMDVRLERR